MPGYDDHRRIAEVVATIASTLLALLLWWWSRDPYLSLTAGSVCFVATTLGNLLPDLDSPSSVPRRRFVRLIQLALPIGLLAIASLYSPILYRTLGRSSWLHGDPVRFYVAILIGLAGISGLGIYLAPTLLDLVLPAHRGPLHEFRIWLVLIIGIVATVYIFDLQLFGNHSLQRDVLLLAVAGGLLSGVFIHLLIDGELR